MHLKERSATPVVIKARLLEFQTQQSTSCIIQFDDLVLFVLQVVHNLALILQMSL